MFFNNSYFLVYVFFEEQRYTFQNRMIKPKVVSRFRRRVAGRWDLSLFGFDRFWPLGFCDWEAS